MPIENPPVDPAAQLQWLVDREAIRNLIFNFGLSLDTKDTANYTSNFTEDAVLDLPLGRIEGREAIAAMPAPPADWSAQHLFGNIVIDLAGDKATTRAYMMGTHIFSATDITQNAHGGGWYEHEIVRTPYGWRISYLKLVIVWESERPMIPDGPGSKPAS